MRIHELFPGKSDIVKKKLKLYLTVLPKVIKLRPFCPLYPDLPPNGLLHAPAHIFPPSFVEICLVVYALINPAETNKKIEQVIDQGIY